MFDGRQPADHCKEILLCGADGRMGCAERSILALDGHREIIIVGFIFTVFVLVHDGGVHYDLRGMNIMRIICILYAVVFLLGCTSGIRRTGKMSL